MSTSNVIVDQSEYLGYELHRCVTFLMVSFDVLNYRRKK